MKWRTEKKHNAFYKVKRMIRTHKWRYFRCEGNSRRRSKSVAEFFVVRFKAKKLGAIIKEFLDKEGITSFLKG